jgi:hypothetical protein
LAEGRAAGVESEPCATGGSPGGTLLDHAGELGSITATTLYNGNACQARLFLPWGEAANGAGSCGMHQQFAKLPDYDAETDQYNTANRHYSPMGRWLSWPNSFCAVTTKVSTSNMISRTSAPKIRSGNAQIG